MKSNKLFLVILLILMLVINSYYQILATDISLPTSDQATNTVTDETLKQNIIDTTNKLKNLNTKLNGYKTVFYSEAVAPIPGTNHVVLNDPTKYDVQFEDYFYFNLKFLVDAEINGKSEPYSLFNTKTTDKVVTGDTTQEKKIDVVALDKDRHVPNFNVLIHEIKKTVIETELTSMQLQMYLGMHFERNYSDSYKNLRDLIKIESNYDKLSEKIAGTGSEDVKFTLKDESGKDVEVTIPSISKDDNEESYIYNAAYELHKYSSTFSGIGIYYTLIFNDLTLGLSNNDKTTYSNSTLDSISLLNKFIVDRQAKSTSSPIMSTISGKPKQSQYGIYDYSIPLIQWDDMYNKNNNNTGSYRDNLYYINIANPEDLNTFRGLISGILDFNNFNEIINVRYGFKPQDVYNSSLSSNINSSTSPIEPTTEESQNTENTDSETDNTTKANIIDEGKIKENLGEWRKTDGTVISYILSNLSQWNEAFKKFGIQPISNDLVSTNIKSFNSLLDKYGLEKFSVGNETGSNINDINDYTSLGIIRDLFKQNKDNSYTTSDIYKELLAWSSGFVPFQTNLYNSTSETATLSGQADKVWKTYSKYRQPLLVTNNTSNVYSQLLSASPTKLEYITLNEYVSRIQKEQDVFLFVNTYSPDDIKKLQSDSITINDNIQINEEVIVDKENDDTQKEQDVFLFVNTYSPDDIKKLQSDSITINDNIQINEEVIVDKENDDTADKENDDTPTEDESRSSQQVSSGNSSNKLDSSNLTSNERYFGPVYGASDKENDDTPTEDESRSSQQVSSGNSSNKLDSSNLTSNERYFGPVYGASYNHSVNKKAHRNVKNGLNPGSFNTISNATINGLYGNTTNSNIKGIHTLQAVKEDGTEVSVEFDNEVLTSIMTQSMLPDNLVYNYMLAFNTLEDKNYQQDILESDLSQPLYLDFMGNIVTETGFVVVPAIANATRFTDNSSTSFFHAMFINSYPDIKVNSEGKFVLDKEDENKFIFHRTDGYIFFEPNVEGDVTVDYLKENYASGFSKWFFNERITVGKLNKSGDAFRNSVDVLFPRADSYTTNKVVGNELSKDKTKMSTQHLKLIDERGYKEDQNIINMFSTDNLYSQNYGKWYSFTKKAIAVFSWNKSFPVINLTVNDMPGKSFLGKIPSTLNSYEVAALKELNYNIMTLLEEQKSTSYLNLDTTMSIVVALYNGSSDTTVTDFSFIDYKARLKDDKLSYVLGTFFESIYNPFISSNGANMISYIATPSKIAYSLDFASKIPIFMLGFMFIIIIVILILMITYAQRNGTFSLADLFKALIISLLTCSFILKGLNPTTDLLFQVPNNKLLEDANLLMTLNHMEKSLKNEDNTYFSLEDEKKREDAPSIVLKKLTKEEALQYREITERPEYQFFYYPEFDSSKAYIFDNVYIQNLELKIDLDDFLSASNVNNFIQSDNNLVYEHTINPEANKLVYYTPQFHFIESITNTINKYSQATSNYFSTLNYDTGAVKTTGRVKSYTDSIFFVAPDKLEEFIKLNNEDPANLEATLKGKINTTVNEDKEFDSENKSENVDGVDNENDKTLSVTDNFTFTDRNGEEIILTSNIVSALEYIQTHMDMTEPNDWLGINNILDTRDNNIFNESFIEQTKQTRWFPVLTAFESDDVLQEAILRVNDNTKEFVLNYLDSVSDTVSDENLIKIIALKATLEFNKEFNFASRGIVAPTSVKDEIIPTITFQYLYPVTIDGSTGDNDFMSKMYFMPLNDIFRSTGNSLGYYLGTEMPISGLLLGLIERILFIFRFLVRNLAFIIMMTLSIIAIITLITKKSAITRTILKINGILFLISLPFTLLEIGIFKLQLYLANIYELEVIMAINLTIGIALTIIYSACIYYIIEFFKDMYVNITRNLFNNMGKIMGDIRDNTTRTLEADLPEDYVAPLNQNTYDEDIYFEEDFKDGSIVKVSEDELEALDTNKYNVYKTEDDKYYVTKKTEDIVSDEISILNSTAKRVDIDNNPTNVEDNNADRPTQILNTDDSLDSSVKSENNDDNEEDIELMSLEEIDDIFDLTVNPSDTTNQIDYNEELSDDVPSPVKESLNKTEHIDTDTRDLFVDDEQKIYKSNPTIDDL